MKKGVFLMTVEMEKSISNLRIDNRLATRDVTTILIKRALNAEKAGKITTSEIEELKKMKSMR